MMLFAPKIHALIHIPASKTSRPFDSRLTLATRSLEDPPRANKRRIKQRSTCGKSTVEHDAEKKAPKKKWPRKIWSFRPPQISRSHCFLALSFLPRHARRTKRKRDYSWSETCLNAPYRTIKKTEGAEHNFSSITFSTRDFHKIRRPDI